MPALISLAAARYALATYDNVALYIKAMTTVWEMQHTAGPFGCDAF